MSEMLKLNQWLLIIGAIAIIWAFAVHSVWLSSAGLFVTAAALINEHFIGLSDVRVKSFNPLTIVFTWWR